MSTSTLSPLHRLSALGQSVWVDFLSRESIRGGHLQQLLDDDAVVGATSNPTIFQKAMSAGDAYDEQMRELAEEGLDASETFWRLAERDIKDACDLFRPIWEGGRWAATATSRWRSIRGWPTTRSRRSARRSACTRRWTGRT